MEKNFFEYDAWRSHRYVCGIDEVGRGSLVGPVVVAAVILPLHASHEFLKDSKVMTEKQRLTADAWIRAHSWYATAYADTTDIETTTIYQATLFAMKKALLHLLTHHQHLSPQLHSIIIDAMPLSITSPLIDPKTTFHHMHKAESLSSSVAAASIHAKVTRDELMKKIHKLYPLYHLDKHKGYATDLHRQAIYQHRLTPLHRVSFSSNALQGNSYDKQQSLFSQF